MKITALNAARIAPAFATLALVLSLDAAAQVPPADLDKLVKYAQCMRANGFPEYPDPSPDGRMQMKLDRKAGTRLEAAERACKDKRPPGMAAMDEAVTPQRMQVLLGFAACVRGQGVKGFPDPSPTGVFELGGPDLMSTPQARQAVERCRESNPPGALAIRIQPK